MEHRKTFGVFINQIDGWFQSPLLKGLRETAIAHRFNLIFFAGKSLQSTVYDDSEHNRIFSLAQADRLDGLILCTGPLTNYITPEAFQSFLKPFAQMPIVSIGVEMEGTPSIVCDNKSGIEAVIEHLVNKHHFRRIGFIAGPEMNTDAGKRKIAYLDSMKRHGLEVKEEWIFQGNFMEESGSKAADYFFGGTEKTVDAVVSANDDMVLGFMLRMQEMGFTLPDHAAVTGYDDLLSMQLITPPATSVHQPIREMAYKAGEILCELASGHTPPMLTSFPAELVVRQSCGCIPVSIASSELEPGQVRNFTAYTIEFDKTKKRVRARQEYTLDLMLKEISPVSKDIGRYRSYLADLIGDLMADLEEKRSNGRFIQNLNAMITNEMIRKMKNYSWKNAFQVLRSAVLSQISNYEILSNAENIFHMVQTLLSETSERRNLYESYHDHRTFLQLRHFIRLINSSLDLSSLIHILEENLPAFGIRYCCLCLYESRQSFEPQDPMPELSHLVMGLHPDGTSRFEVFETRKILPDELLYPASRMDIIMMPLFAEKIHFGYLALDLGGAEDYFFETLREQISNALRNQMLFEERLKVEQKLRETLNTLEEANNKLHELTLQDELTGLYNRRGFFLHGERHYQLASSTGRPFIVFFITLGGLREKNEKFGRDEGDALIASAAGIIRKSFHKYDIIARTGGLEILALAVDRKAEEAIGILEQLHQHLKEWHDHAGLETPLTLQAGWTGSEESPESDLNDLVVKAEERKKTFPKKN